MKIIELFKNGLLTLSLEGELDARSSIPMDKAMKKAYKNGQFDVLIDCDSLSYVSSAGMGVFISHLDDFSVQNGKIVFCNMNDRVFGAFELLGLNAIFSIAGDEEEAKALF